jgi:N-6 DNA Methylase/TaqI-like C-terminal specificity domain
MTAPHGVTQLVREFGAQREICPTGVFTAARVRSEFIDPLFRALGWDVDNSQGLSPARREVVREGAVPVEGNRKAPDYSFRIDGRRAFFVEARKPSATIGAGPGPAFQLRRYAWSAGLPISIVTDFEEFALYDGRPEPKPDDDAAVARLMFFGFADLATEWEKLESIVSYQAVRGGSLEEHAQTSRVKRGSCEVGGIFLAELEQWRRCLAQDIAVRNTSLTSRHLNVTVQETIDRVVFLRIAEARGIEVSGQLQNLLNGPDIYGELVKLFRRADRHYNSELFDFGRDVNPPEEPGELTPGIRVGDDALARILRRLCCPESPYEFSVLPTAILGQVYEQFLGQVITLNDGRQADVVLKPEVRKSGGVYYTPAPIVDHILNATLSPLLKDRSPQSAAGRDNAPDRHPLRVVDPSCGSGTFLLGAYDYLLRWYLDAYTTGGAERWAGGRSPRLRRGPGGDWELTTAERQDILLRHIYGVDSDQHAVEVTKLSLLLMVAEGQPDRARPDLAGNIRCGNAVIEPDFDDHQPLLADDENRTRVSVFDWRREFSSVFASAGGFDAVIGNPPYLDSETMTQFTPEWRDYCASKYRAAAGNWDMFCVFIERALDLCRPGGYHSFIVPNKLGSANYARNIRAIIAGENHLLQIRDYASVPLFPASVYPVVYSVRKQARDDTVPVLYERMAHGEAGTAGPVLTESLDRPRYFRSDGSPWAIFADIAAGSPVERLSRSFPALSAMASVHGAATVAEAYELVPLITEAGPAAPGDLRVVNSGTIDRYVNLWGNKPMRYLGNSYVHPVVPQDAAGRLPAVRLRQARTPKVIVAGMSRVLECIADLPGTLLPAKSTAVIESDADLCWLLGILNSRLMSFYFLSVYGGDRLHGGYLRIGPPQLRTLPVPEYDQASDIHRALAERVRRLLAVWERRPVAAASAEPALATRQVQVLEEQIDQLVYRIYGLSDAERLVVEQSAEPRSGPPGGRD